MHTYVMCMHVHADIYLNICVYTWARVYVHTMCTRCICVAVCECMCMYVYIYAVVCVCMVILVVLIFELRTSHVLGRHFTT